ncbi:hypothetical protein [Occallatibacter riparius]|uniref:Uncharacterized protein n=1 Tax=Occallatibacter riparius TaxID=1002689 RepID=A0A9J7BKL4_9BACT|nr:hypothetical protein [Occallatibacter riparius]UWZ82985.1 hypothetical protein MOP44_20730 [Occallatibacter riparius]
MTPNRHRNAWIWVAITAIALATVARAESGFELARVYANPVLVYLATDHQAQAAETAQIHKGSVAAARALSSTSTNSGMWLELLPILFVGLLLPFGLLSPLSSLSLGRQFAAPAIPALFQRPPPAQLL